MHPLMFCLYQKRPHDKKHIIHPVIRHSAGKTVILSCIIIFIGAVTQAHANREITEAGDFIQLLLPGLAIGSTFISGSPEGRMWNRDQTKQAVLSIGSTSAIVAATKGAVHKLRPDGSAGNSFPSGHTSAAFSGAFYLGSRYGWKWGIPAYLAAAFVGYSRYQSDNHYVDDILAGAGIALLSNWYHFRPMKKRFILLPIADDKSIGIQLVGRIGAAQEEAADYRRLSFNSVPTRYRLNFQFGRSYTLENKVASDDENPFDIGDIQTNNDALTTIKIELELALRERHQLNISFWPMESKDEGSSAIPLVYMGKTFPANQPLSSDWMVFDTRLGYLYNLSPFSQIILKAGGGAMLQYHRVEIETQDRMISADEDHLLLLPFLSAQLGYHFTDKLSACLNIDFGAIPETWMADAKIAVHYSVTRNWRFSVGYEQYVRNFRKNEVENQITHNLPYLGVAYSW